MNGSATAVRRIPGAARAARAVKGRGGKEVLGRDAWIAAARKTLISEGFAAVKVDRLAKALGVTRGGFYWRFSGLPDLLDALVEDWRSRNTAPLLAALGGGDSVSERFRRLMHTWIEEKAFSPDYDTAIREWSRTDPKVARIVRRIDDERINAFKTLFKDAGYAEQEALVRARVVYYHQVGYYAMGVHESKKTRMALSETYQQVLTGFA